MKKGDAHIQQLDSDFYIEGCFTSEKCPFLFILNTVEWSNI